MSWMEMEGEATLGHALQHMQEAHEEALDLCLLQFVTSQQGAAQGGSRVVLPFGHTQTNIILAGSEFSHEGIYYTAVRV